MKTVLITGASRGIGRVLALAFGKAGYAVAVNCVTSNDLAESVVSDLAKAGQKKAAVYVCDVRDSLKVRQMMDDIVKKWGRLDVLINNAGIVRDRTILKMTNGDWNDVIDTNLSGPFWCLREAARVMVDQKAGSIVNVSSIMGLRGGYGNANYSAAKAGLIALSKSAARELGRFGIRVNAVLPGFHPTDMSAGLTPERLEKIKAEHPLGQTTRPADLAAMILAIVENGSLSGQVFNIDSRIA